MLNVGSDRSRQRALEDYVKAIDYLGVELATVRAADVARHLKISAASVSQFRPILEAEGLIDPGAELRLTARGRELAGKMNRRHGIIETFLHASLDVPLERLHGEAERLEHVVSDDIVERLASFVGDPAVNPLGHRIPRRAGDARRPRDVRVGRAVPLAACAVGAAVVVTSIDDDEPAVVKVLAARRVLPGFACVVTARGREGDVRLRDAASGKALALDAACATRVRCVARANDRPERPS